MKTKFAGHLLVGLVCAGLFGPSAEMAAGMSIGGGAYYQKTVGEIEENDDFDDDAISWLVSLQMELPVIFTLEGDLEITPDYGGSDETLLQPQAYLLIGSLIYAGAGIGVAYLDGEWSDDPFYALRAGLDIPLGDRVSFDINANYRFMDSSVFDDLDEEDSDSITFGALIRFDL